MKTPTFIKRHINLLDDKLRIGDKMWHTFLKQKFTIVNDVDYGIVATDGFDDGYFDDFHNNKYLKKIKRK